MINANMLRPLWAIVETTQAEALINLNENELVDWLCATIQEQQLLSGAQADALKQYLSTHTSLIKDLADSRLF